MYRKTEIQQRREKRETVNILNTIIYLKSTHNDKLEAERLFFKIVFGMFFLP